MSEGLPATADPTLQAIVFVLSSGAEIAAANITLWPKDQLDRAADMLARAGVQNQGFSTGLGFIGSFGWVVSRSLLLGAIESAVSHAMQNGAEDLCVQAAQCIDRAARQAYSAPVAHIANIETPTPGIWASTYRWPHAQRTFVHSGEPFLRVKTIDGATRNIMWAAVEQQYSVRSSANVLDVTNAVPEAR
jgi:hypothetical protein